MAGNQIFKAVMVAVALFIINLLITACPYCPESKTYYYNITQIHTLNMNNEDREPKEQTSDTIPAKAFVLRITFTTEKTDSNQILALFQCSGNRALAMFDPPECIDYFRLKDTMVYVKIYSTRDFDGEHPAGSSLNDYFICPDCWYGSNLNPQINLLTPKTSFDFLLMHQPSFVDRHMIIVETLLSDGTVMSDTTNPVVLSL